jgi:glycosyltransferase involved in cell wall biosynthesis
MDDPLCVARVGAADACRGAAGLVEIPAEWFFKAGRGAFPGFAEGVPRALGVARNSAMERLLLVEILGNRARPKQARNANRDSRKLVFVDHAFHQKTRSSAFLVDYLEHFYDVHTVLDESWRREGEPFPDLSFVDESYQGVIFWQILPSRDVIDRIDNSNLVLFPMYDSVVGSEYRFWRKFRKLKVVSFSSTLHEKLAKWGFESIYVQYFPKPTRFMPGARDEVFFWQRTTKIDVSTVVALLGDEPIRIHIHSVADPGQELAKPSEKDEERYHITYSDWSDSRDEMWELMSQKGIYVAPRQYEGIGLSFLEAMAMGKAVVAANTPTMNEYIEHGKTGYLFDLSRPERISLSDIESIQEQAYEFMCNGHKTWEEEKARIIEFIER